MSTWNFAELKSSAGDVTSGMTADVVQMLQSVRQLMGTVLGKPRQVCVRVNWRISRAKEDISDDCEGAQDLTALATFFV